MTPGKVESEIHIGEIVKAEMKRQGMTKSAFAKRINNSATYISRLMKNRVWGMMALKEASEILGRDFFKDLLMAKTLEEIEKDKMRILEQDEQISKLEKQIEEMREEMNELNGKIVQKEESIALLKEITMKVE